MPLKGWPEKEMHSANLSGPLKGLRPYHALLGLMARRKILCKRFSTKSRKLAVQKRSSLPAESLAPSIPPRAGRYARRLQRECRPGGGGS